MAGFNITVAGDSAINLEFGNVISEKTNGIIRAAAPQAVRLWHVSRADRWVWNVAV